MTTTDRTTPSPEHRPFLTPVATVLGTTIVWLTGAWGWWWVALVLGLVVGLMVRRRLACWCVGLGSGLLGWGLPLAWMSISSPVARASTDLSSLMGYSFSAMAVLVTLVVGSALGACGTWLGRALRAYAPAAAPDQPS